MKFQIDSSIFLIFLLFFQYISTQEESAQQIASELFEDGCDIVTDGPISIDNGNRIFVPSARPDSIILHYDFEDAKVINKVGNDILDTKCEKKLKIVPGYGGLGAAAVFNQNACVSKTKFYLDNDFTISFFINIQTESENYYPIFFIGDSKNYFIVKYDFILRKIVALYNNEQLQLAEGEKVQVFSPGRLSIRRWYHIAVVKNNQQLVLYVNGIKNNVYSLTNISFQRYNTPIYLGNVVKISENETDYYLLQEFKVYQKEIDKNFIQAEAAILLGGIAPSLFEIGCIECEYEQSVQLCNQIESYRLCSSIELYSGGINVLRSLGLIHPEQHLWTTANEKEKENLVGQQGLGLCCAIL